MPKIQTLASRSGLSYWLSWCGWLVGYIKNFAISLPFSNKLKSMALKEQVEYENEIKPMLTSAKVVMLAEKIQKIC